MQKIQKKIHKGTTKDAGNQKEVLDRMKETLTINLITKNLY